MSRFTIIPIDKRKLPTNFIGTDAGSSLAIIERLNCGEVDVLKNKKYLFSAELSECGVWSIFGRTQDRLTAPAVHAGSSPARQSESMTTGG